MEDLGVDEGIIVLSRVGVTYKTGLWAAGNYSAITILHTLQFTVAHVLGFPVFTSRILATEL
jgi:hypothetical protein